MKPVIWSGAGAGAVHRSLKKRNTRLRRDRLLEAHVALVTVSKEGCAALQLGEQPHQLLRERGDRLLITGGALERRVAEALRDHILLAPQLPSRDGFTIRELDKQVGVFGGWSEEPSPRASRALFIEAGT